MIRSFKDANCGSPGLFRKCPIAPPFSVSVAGGVKPRGSTLYLNEWYVSEAIRRELESGIAVAVGGGPVVPCEGDALPDF
ncbi:MAG: hypothetical protein JXA18_15275 [Chitinispirillaceae bacterium]|nr:hypothetical protein [Chitinispirillaceae bacterium]